MDLIFGSGNGVAPVDDMWFENAVQAEAVGVPVWLSPAEELLWSKSFVMERERYDGADVIHILHARGPTLDWARLLDRFGDYWRVLLLNLVLYGFVYPGEESPAPRWVTDSLVSRFQDETAGSAEGRAHLPRHADLARAVSHRHSRVGLRAMRACSRAGQ